MVPPTSISSRRRLLFNGMAAIVVVLMLLSTACSLPFIRPKPTSTPEATNPHQVKPQKEDLPPMVVETMPLPKSALPADGRITLYFNQKMDTRSVEAALKVVPALGGKYKWSDDATLVFSPDKALSPGTELTLTLDTTAKAANGLALPDPVIFTFQSPAPLEASEMLPNNGSVDVSASSAIVVSFNQPVVALGAEAGDNPAAFTVDPPVEGTAEWLNTSTYILRPDQGLAGGTTYTVTLNQDLTSTAGTGLQDIPAWVFRTTLPRIIKTLPTEMPMDLDQSIEITFNQAMDATSTESATSIKNEAEIPVPGSFEWNDAGNILTWKPSGLLDYNENYVLNISTEALSFSGTPLENDYINRFQTVPTLGLKSMYPKTGEPIQVYMGGYGSVSLEFTTPLLLNQDWEQMVTFSPPIEDANYYGYNRSIYVSAFFTPDTAYTLTISSNLLDKWGRRMGNPISKNLRTSGLTPQLSILPIDMGPHILTIIPRETAIAAQATNLPGLDISMAAYNPQEAIIGEDKDSSLMSLSPDMSWHQDLNLVPNRDQAISIDLQPDGSKLDPGLYIYHIFSYDARDFYGEKHFMAVVSRVQMLLKVSQETLFLWALNLRDDIPAAGESVTVYDHDGTILAEGVTDADGILKVDLPPGRENFESIYAVMNEPGDDLFGMARTGMSFGIQPWQFGMSFSYKENEPSYYMYTDRPIYRPGQTVYFRIAAHNQSEGRYSIPDISQVSFQLYSPYDVVTGTHTLMQTIDMELSPYGTASGEFTLPEDAAPGFYSLESTSSDDYQSITFQVAEYRKPEIDLSVESDESQLLTGDDLNISADVRYYFGAPAGSLPIHWSVYARDDYFNIPGGYQVGKNDNWLRFCWFYCTQSWGFPLLEGDDYTDADGLFSLHVAGSDLAGVVDVENKQKIMVEFTITDESGFPVSARTEVTLHPDDFYIGIRSDAWSGAAESIMGFDILTVNWQGKPWGNLDLVSTFSRIEWEEGGINPDTGEQQYNQVLDEVASTDLTTGTDGKARVAFTPPDPGVYMLQVRGSSAISQTQVWVGGSGAAAWPRSPNQRIQPLANADFYEPGDTASIFIPNSLPGTVFGLAAIERRNVIHWETFSFEGSSYTLELPITDEYAPNVFVSITLISYPAGQKPDFLMGYLPLQVDVSDELLEVEVSPEADQSGPGEEMTYTIHAADSQGKPVQAEFSFSLVDKAVLALADPNSEVIEKAFYDPFPLGVYSSLSLASYNLRSLPAPAGGFGRGGGGGEESGIVPPPTREDFRDTAYWNPSVVTDNNGTAQVTLTLPDNLTTWVADVRGLTTDVKVGSDTCELITTKPLLVRPVTPRFLVLGDRVELAAIVHNNTSGTLETQVFLNGGGFTLDDPALSIQPVTIESGGRVRVSWWGTVEGTDSLDLTFGATAGEYNDLTKPIWGKLPVLRYSSPQTFGTAGFLATGGERLEIVSLPRSYEPTGAELQLEVMPSLAASILSDLRTIEPYDLDYTEPALSTLMPNLSVYKALTDLELDRPDLMPGLQDAIMDVIERLERIQNSDGGWGWTANKTSNLYLTTYALFALKEAELTGFYVKSETMPAARDYIISNLYPAKMDLDDWQINQLAFIEYTLSLLGESDRPLEKLYTLRERMDPWAKALLALSIAPQNPSMGDTLLIDLKSTASRVATGTYWTNTVDDWHCYSSSLSTSAFVIYALARMDPASDLLVDAVRYLSLNRKATGGWGSSYENAWIMFALVQYLKGTGELKGNYTWQATLNSTPLASGEVSGVDTTNTVNAAATIDQLLRNDPNALRLERSEGTGRLYYRAYLQVDRPVETIPPVQRGMTIERVYYPIAQDCRLPDCESTSEASLGAENPVLLVRLTLTVPENLYYVVVKDIIPAGTEVVNEALKTTRQGEQSGELETYNPDDPFARGWGWWIFEQPKIYDDSIQWIAEQLPAGTYQLTYKLLPTQAGEFRVLPARAWEYYFPEVEAGTPGEIFTITP